MNSLLAAPTYAGALSEIYEKGGFLSKKPPETLDALVATGVLSQAHLRDTADKLTLAWYSGVCEGPGGPVVVTFTGALAWKALSYTNAPTVCGGPFGFWADAPRST